ncbi:MAG: HpaII family restriction endonuclease [Cytophagia bacterium]|nr:MAG: HpaII family restriction endonuclease [Runella sp.]TAG18142.1 MAG: HpaII family restriction endonuclease [Cytophagales bacterium]TAG37687.1 MAG: HpaII family restriction endonuclease [Cytophagia bacterium]TAG52048.1 MAG: HpaII family restriction endonuclease [Runella slithyformis]TAG78836.1 MAG: HpaII family restriction endonuclease [Cytophagales bacterium]
MNNSFTFIDLFAGIGGFHLAMHRLGGECVFASEIDEFARLTYEANHKKISPKLFENNLFNKDIRTITPKNLPDFDILCAGFPCQPFSQAGHKRGFEDNHNSERGNLFFNIAEILEAKKPKAFFLENVRGLVTHDDGNTFKIIRNILEDELGYSFYFKVIHASDYGLPQLRPRAFMVGFRDEDFMKSFTFPPSIPLKFNMSDVWGGKCTREIGFTIRIGGRGSVITDRRNWDNYSVDGELKRLSYIEARKMQGFPDDFIFPVSPAQAIKQLGNSVAVDAVEAVAKNILGHLKNLTPKRTILKTTKNKGEWTELLVFIKLLLEKQLSLSDAELNKNTNYLKINKVTTHNLDIAFLLSNLSTVIIKNKEDKSEKEINISEIINAEIINLLISKIKDSSQTFEISEFNIIQDKLGFNVIKGGNSNQKADILLDIENNFIQKENEGFGIKSYLGSKPTLLNASGNTNFIFKINGVNKSYIDEVNAIDTATKLKDRLHRIEELGGTFEYIGAERDTMGFNLKMVDSEMPKIIGQILLLFYKERTSSLADITNKLLGDTKNEDRKILLTSKIKKLLVDILLGFFAGTKWNGSYEANGTIVMKNNGDCVGFHIIELDNLKNYLFENIKLDTPSTTRHRFGKLYLEKDGELYFKLNLQLRF